ncbi:MAG: DUF2167 domain-containing protein [bacterium]|nr:DUF2167 domain-containing protein [bacterium]
MHSKKYCTKFSLLLWGLLLAIPFAAVGAQDEVAPAPAPEIDWVNGPATEDLGDWAQVKVPASYRFAAGDDTRKIMAYFGNPPTDIEYGYIEPQSPEENWFAVFEFNETGYIKDDDKNDIDADAILADYREGMKSANEWRRERGEADLNLVGWKIEPKYYESTNTIEWATTLESRGQRIVNYNIRMLGREGVMEVTIVLDEGEVQPIVANMKKILTGYEFKSGHRYADFVEGDKVAEYGLAALVAGGAVAVAAQTGILAALFAFLRKGWYIVVAAVAGAFSWIKNRLGGNTVRASGGSSNSENAGPRSNDFPS